MNNNGLVECKESFITKIRKFFKKLFEKKDYHYNSIQEKTNENISTSVNNEKKDDFIVGLSVENMEINNDMEKDNFLKEIEGNAEKLNMLSIDRLQKLKKYYDSIIAENDKKIKKLKATT